MSRRIYACRYAHFEQRLGMGDLYRVIDEKTGERFGDVQPKPEAEAARKQLQALEDAREREDAAVIGMLIGR